MVLLLGYGFIGKHLYQFFKKNGVSIRVFSNHVIHNPESEFYCGNYDELTLSPDVFDEVDTIIHLIHTTVPSSSFDNSLFDLQSNVVPTIKLLEFLKAKPHIRLIYISSAGAIYGQPLVSQVTESHPTNPLSPYGISKLCIEKYLIFYKTCFNCNITIIRPSNVYGCGQDFSKPQGVIGHLIRSVINQSEFELCGDGNGRKDYLYIDDFVEAIYLVFTNNHTDKFVFNLSYGEVFSINELIASVEMIADARIRIKNMVVKKFDVSNIAINSDLFRNYFNWYPKISLKQGIEIIVHQMNNS